MGELLQALKPPPQADSERSGIRLSLDVALARRIILAHGGSLDDQAGRTRVAFLALTSPSSRDTKGRAAAP